THAQASADRLHASLFPDNVVNGVHLGVETYAILQALNAFVERLRYFRSGGKPRRGVHAAVNAAPAYGRVDIFLVELVFGLSSHALSRFLISTGVSLISPRIASTASFRRSYRAVYRCTSLSVL